VSTRVAEFLGAARVADVGVVDDEVSRLVFLVLGTGMVKIGELIEGKLAVAFGIAEEMRFGAAVDVERGQFGAGFRVRSARGSVREGRGRR